MPPFLWLLIGIAFGALASAFVGVYLHALRRGDPVIIERRVVDVDELIESALGHKPLPRGSTIDDIPRQARHRADDLPEEIEEPTTDQVPSPRWPQNEDTVQPSE